MPRDDDSRNALLAGATGLIGRALLPLLLESPRHARVHALLRRAGSDLPKHPKLALIVAPDFTRLPALPPLDDAFIALGTTLEVAGSRAAFRRVDLDAVVDTARAAKAAGAQRAIVVSALGAGERSRVFYNRVKGEMQRAVASLGFETVVFAQPSLLLGDRATLGQPERPIERLAMRLSGPLLGFMPAAVRPIRAVDVARAMLDAALDARAGVRVLGSGQMQP